MAPGRPKGSKNKSVHSAGGDRRSGKYKKQVDDEKVEQQQSTGHFFVMQRKKAVEPPKWTDHRLCQTNFRESQTMLAEVLDHPSMRQELPHSVEVEPATVDTGLPGFIEQVNRRLSGLEQAVRESTEAVKDLKMEMKDLIKLMKEAMPKMVEQTMLATLQSVLSQMSTMVGDMRVDTAAGATAPLAMLQQTIPVAVNPVVLERISSFAFQSKHNSLKGLWDEWHGTGNYQDQPIAGGVAALEKKYGAKWRKPESNVSKRISTQGRICLGIQKKAEAQSKSIDSVCNEWNQKYEIEFNQNMRRFVQYLQDENWLPVQARRGQTSDT